MKKTLKKMQRVKPLIMAKQAVFDQEVALLGKIAHKKREAVATLRVNQQKYMRGADQMNHERATGNNSGALVLEPAVEYVKLLCHQSIKVLKDLEDQEKTQIGKVFDAQKELKSFEALEEKYQTQFNRLVSITEQKELDEMAVNMRSRKN